MPLFDSNSQILEVCQAIQPWVVDIRRQLHQMPELLYELHETNRFVCQTLDELDVSYRSGLAKTGVLATIGTGDGRCVMLRADMDALPIEEQADIDFRSRNSGRMHACGHDCHTAMLLGAAKILKERESELAGTVKLCFQPAEEGGAGGKQMCEEGVMENPKVDKVFGIHVWPMIPTGQLTGRPGAFLAATNGFQITVTGKGGHAAMPHFCVDPVVTAAKIITNLQSLVSREQNPLEPAVISFTAIHGGEAHNVIPPVVTIKGTIRSLTSSNKDHLKQRVAESAKALAEADRCTAVFESCGTDYPETFNDPGLWNRVHQMGKSLFGESNFELCDPMMGGEDFAYYGAHAPACFVALGCRNESEGCVYGLHHPQFKMDESAFSLGTALHLAFVSEQLAN